MVAQHAGEGRRGAALAGQASLRFLEGRGVVTAEGTEARTPAEVSSSPRSINARGMEKRVEGVEDGRVAGWNAFRFLGSPRERRVGRGPDALVLLSPPPEETRSPKRGIGDRFWCLLFSRLQNLVVNEVCFTCFWEQSPGNPRMNATRPRGVNWKEEVRCLWRGRFIFDQVFRIIGKWLEGVCPLFHFYNIVLFSASKCWPMNFYVCGDGLMDCAVKNSKS